MRRIACKALVAMGLCVPPIGATAGEVSVVPLPVGVGVPGFGKVIAIRTPVDRVIWLESGTMAEAIPAGTAAIATGQATGVAAIALVGSSREAMIGRLEAELRSRASQ